MKRNLSTKKIIAEIEKRDLEFSHEKNKIVVSTNEHFEALKSALCRIRRYYSKNISVKEALKHLSPREYNIIDLRFFQGKTQMEVAKEVQISQAQVSRLEKNALEKLREQL